MAYQKLQAGRALSVAFSDYCEIPFPAVTVSSTNTSTFTNQLIDSSVDFIALNVQTGDIVYNTTASTGATVVKVISSDTIEINADIFLSSGDTYKIYAGGNNEGCVLYVGSGGIGTFLNVETVGGDIISFANIADSTFIPVQVLKVFSSSSVGKVVALW